ncbi:uncharacterized protein LOC122393488 [Amphibalanus amphitrite]|uniref:uncharacterized protein LOC122393488 n=1 Tax=Amphibalanus amphitrite TaxID=1232801 RepID=UPI001C907FD1|nr:uncharacterized protein LOC122393488 [Amphibalanus amphitrite]
MFRPLLPLLALVVGFVSLPLSGSYYIETRYGDRNYFCRDRYGFVGDCRDGKLRPREDYDNYGYREDRYGRKVGQGYYNMIGSYDAEMICDFARDGRVRDDVMDIVWWKVYDEDDDYRRRGRDYDSPFRRYRMLRHRERGDRDRRRYRFSYRRYYDSPHYRRSRHYDYRRGLMRDDDYINGYRDWYNDDHFRSSLRVYTQGDRSTLYLRDIQPEDLGLYRCQGRLRSRSRRDPDDDMVYMDIQFYPVAN